MISDILAPRSCSRRGVHPKFVQELLGHTTIAITLDLYSHVIPAMGDHTRKAMEDLLS